MHRGRQERVHVRLEISKIRADDVSGVEKRPFDRIRVGDAEIENEVDVVPEFILLAGAGIFAALDQHLGLAETRAQRCLE
jgi:hypothetical protein